LGKQKRKQLLYQIGQDKVFLKKYNLTRKIVEKQAALDPVSDDALLLTIFLTDGDKAERLSVGYILTEDL
jgi:hypothetical protein